MNEFLDRNDVFERTSFTCSNLAFYNIGRDRAEAIVGGYAHHRGLSPDELSPLVKKVHIVQIPPLENSEIDLFMAEVISYVNRYENYQRLFSK